MNQILKTEYAELVLWCDSAFQEYEDLNMRVVDPQRIKSCQYDKIIIAIASEKNVHEVINTLCNMGIEKEKIIWREPRYERKYI